MRQRVVGKMKYHNKSSMWIVGLLVFFLAVVLFIQSSALKEELEKEQLYLEELKEQLALEEQEAIDLIEFDKYTQTKKYAEEVAKEKLGMVYEGEILFKEE